MTELCTVCDKHIEKANMPSHIQGKKHLRMAEIIDKDERTIKVRQPSTISAFQLHSFFARHGVIKHHKVTWGAIIYEFTDKKVADYFTKNPIWLNDEKLRIRKGVSYHELQKLRGNDRQQDERVAGAPPKARKKSSVEWTGVINYSNISKLFSENHTFDTQLLAFLNAVQLTDKELEMRYNPICHQLNIMFKSIFPKCKVHKFGSTQMGLGFKECDLDIFMDIGEPIYESNNSTNGWTMSQIFAKMKSVVYRHQQFFHGIVWILKTRVPIIKFRFLPTNVACDVSFKNSLGVHKTNLIRHCLQLDRRVTPLMILIKYWAKHFLNTATTTVGNYALTLLAIFFLQQPSVKILPSIVELQSSCEPEIVDGWQVNYDTTIHSQRNTNTSTIPELLHGFFSFYSTFDFQSRILCPLDGIAHPRTMFKDINQLPAYMNRYKEYVSLNADSSRLMVLNAGICIQDPIELSHNVAVRTSATKLQNFVAFCTIGAEVCALEAKQDNKTLLPNLFITMPLNMLVKEQIALKFIQRPNCLGVQQSCSLAYECVKSALEEIFKLQIESLGPTKNINKILLKCKGAWIDTECETSDISQNTLHNVGSDNGKNSGTRSTENERQLEFLCVFKMQAMPAEFDMVFTNQNPNHEVFRKFISFLNVRLSPIVYRTLHNAADRLQD